MQTHVSLRDYTTFGVGGDARLFLEVKSIEELQDALRFAREEKISFHILGKGSNTLFPDEGFDGLVILNKINFLEMNGKKIYVGGGYSFSLLGNKTARAGLTGLEFASGIPGSVGGAVYMNAGAMGGETADTLSEVTFVDEEGNLSLLKDLEFAYRKSPFQKMRGAIAAARFSLSQSDDARSIQKALVEARTKSQPYADLSCGCIFRNPPGDFAGRLIDSCGLKGKRVGNAEVSTLHANFIVNRGNAQARDILELIQLIKVCVKVQTGVELEMECFELTSTATPPAQTAP